MKLKWILMVCLVVLGSGMTCIAQPDGPPPGGPGGGPGHGEKILERMKTELQLTDDQVAKIKAIHDKYRPELEKIKDDNVLTKEEKREQAKALHEKIKAEVEAVLTPQQKAKWEQIKEEHKKEWQSHKKGGGNSTEEPPPPPPAG